MNVMGEGNLTATLSLFTNKGNGTKNRKKKVKKKNERKKKETMSLNIISIMMTYVNQLNSI